MILSFKRGRQNALIKESSLLIYKNSGITIVSFTSIELASNIFRQKKIAYKLAFFINFSGQFLSKPKISEFLVFEYCQLLFFNYGLK